MTEPDLRSALRPVVEAFAALGIAYFVGGSVASSAYGLPRTTLDVVLHKLVWYRMGGGVSERQWRDVQGVLKVQEHALDLDYMQRWAPTLEITDLLQEALIEAGLLDS